MNASLTHATEQGGAQSKASDAENDDFDGLSPLSSCLQLGGGTSAGETNDGLRW